MVLFVRMPLCLIFTNDTQRRCFAEFSRLLEKVFSEPSKFRVCNCWSSSFLMVIVLKYHHLIIFFITTVLQKNISTTESNHCPNNAQPENWADLCAVSNHTNPIGYTTIAHTAVEFHHSVFDWNKRNLPVINKSAIICTRRVDSRRLGCWHILSWMDG
jgi:hypothetical protein